MPSAQPLPTIRQLLRVFHGEVAARKQDADTHSGSLYDHWAGAGAVLWRRVAERDQEEFRSIYFGTARGTRLDSLIVQRFGRSRVQISRGQGTAILTRPNATAGEGTFWRGTRIAIGDGGASPVRMYRVRTNTWVPPTETRVTLPMEAEKTGIGTAVSGTHDDFRIHRIEDPLWDNSWQLDSIEVADGTLREQDHEYRVNTEQEREDSRVGYTSKITAVMKEAGAAEAVLFPSYYLGTASDHGLNRVYVGDESGESPASLLKACRLALPSVGMAGANIQVLGMTNTLLTMTLTLQREEVPANARRLAEYAEAAVVEYFNTRENPFVWREESVRSAAMRAVSGTLAVTLSASQSEPTLATLFDTPPLQRFRVEPWGIHATVIGSS